MKTRFLLLGFLLVFSTNAFSQWDGYMYWEIRQRFLDKFIRVGEGHGMSIPVSCMHKNMHQKDALQFHDESLRHIGWYLAVLATEHELLQYYGYPTDQNEREMYYAFKAINRLDSYAEFLWDAKIPFSLDRIEWDEDEHKYKKVINNTAFTDYTNANMNGFLIREDVPPGFGQLFTVGGPYVVEHGGNDGKVWIRHDWITGEDEITGERKTVMSQDQFFHLMFGLCFVKKYMGGVSYNGMSFVNEARAFCSRVMINYNGAYNLRNPVMTGGTLNFDEAGPVTDLDENNIGN